MSEFHGIVFAYSSTPELGNLVRTRTCASLPFCGRYRLIDFALSSMRNAGIYNVGVIMQRDYQSLLDHLGSGKDWDMSRRHGGLRMLPPFGLPEYHTGAYSGTVEALNAVSTYVRNIKEKYVVLMHGNLAANLDLEDICRRHEKSGAGITAVCTREPLDYIHHCFIPGADGFAERMLFDRTGAGGEGFASLEAYVISKELLVELMDKCRANNRRHFHRDAVGDYLSSGGKTAIYIHEGYGKRIMSTEAYFRASMDMLCGDKRAALFPTDRPVRAKSHEDVSTYYGENARSVNSLVADGCIIEGEVENCIISSGCRVEKGAKLRDCIIMRGCVIGEGVSLSCVIADKYTEVTPGQALAGSERLPLVIPKHSKI